MDNRSAGECAGPRPALSGAWATAGTGDTLVLTDAVALPAGLPLIIERGTLQSLGQTGVKADETIQKLQLDGAQLRVPFANAASLSKGSGSGSLSEPQPLLAQLAGLNFATLAVRRSRLDIATADGKQIALADVTADMTASRKGACTLKGTATFRGQAVRFEVAWSMAGEAGTAAAGLPVKITVRAQLLDAVLDGRLHMGGDVKLVGSADIRARRLRSLSRWFGLAVPPAGDLRDASLTGAFEWSDQRLVFRKATVVVDGNAGEGALSLSTRGPRPALEGTIAFKVFDLTHQIAAQMATGEAAKGSTATAAARPMPGSLVAAFDADLRLSTAKLLAPRIEAGRGAVAIALKQGRLLADLAELEIEGGTASGQLMLDVNGELPKLGLKAKLEGIDPGRIFSAAVKRSPLLGRAVISLDGSATAATLPEMLAVFAGKGTFAMPDGGRIGVDLKTLAQAARTANHVGWAAAGKGLTAVEQLDARFQLSSGALTIEAFKARSGPTVFIGGGKIDLRGSLLDLNLAIGNAGEQPVVAQEVLVFRGAWGDPAISLLGRPFTSTAPTVPAVKGATAVPPIPIPLPRRD